MWCMIERKKKVFFVDLKKIHYIFFFFFVSGFYWIAKNAWDDWVFEFQNLQDDHIILNSFNMLNRSKMCWLTWSFEFQNYIMVIQVYAMVKIYVYNRVEICLIEILSWVDACIIE